MAVSQLNREWELEATRSQRGSKRVSLYNNPALTGRSTAICRLLIAVMMVSVVLPTTSCGAQKFDKKPPPPFSLPPSPFLVPSCTIFLSSLFLLVSLIWPIVGCASENAMNPNPPSLNQFTYPNKALHATLPANKNSHKKTSTLQRGEIGK